MFILYAIAAGIIAGLLTRGRMTRLGDLRLRWLPLAIGGLLAQVVLFSPAVADRVGSLGPPLYLASTVTVAAFVVRNLHVAGLPLVLVGAVCNVVAIVANGGYMPASPAALDIAGRRVDAGYSNSVEVADPAFPFLTDIFAIPAGIPFANVFSLGDLLIGAGIAWVILTTMHRGAAVAPGATRPLPARN